MASKWLDPITRTVNKAVDAVDGSGLTGGALKDAFNKVKEKGKAVEFIQNTVIDTVEKATTILMNFKGFSFTSNCRTGVPSAQLHGQRLSIGFGSLYCSVTLVGKTVVLFNSNFGHRDVHFPNPLDWLPGQIRELTHAPFQVIQRMWWFMNDLMHHTHHCDKNNPFHCLAKRVARHVMEFEPPLNWLPGQLGELAKVPFNVIQRMWWFMNDLLHHTHHCDQNNPFHCLAKRLGRFVMEFEPPLNFLPSPVKVLAGTHVNSIKSVLAMGNELMRCQHFESGTEVTKCLGNNIIGSVPPLNFLNHLGEIIGETIETFAKAATAVMKKALKGGTSFVQKASVSEFPAVGKMPVVHHQDDHLLVEAHSQLLHPSLLQYSMNAEAGAPEFKLGVGGSAEVTNLITQFDGREADTGSCLAFAPSSKNGAQVENHRQATKADWQSAKKEDFVKLEPWAVPCDNAWMKENWDKWQGYSFYTARTDIEKCISVSFAISIQPVVAFVAGLSVELLPKPLFKLL